METNELAQNVKNLRIRKGYSQEELAEKTGLSLRTIQRIENGETEPRGDSLKRLAMALEVTPEDIVDWTVQEDRGLLAALNLSALSFLIFPLMGIVVPLILWVSKKGKIQGIDKAAKSVLNFQITWLAILAVAFMFLGFLAFHIRHANAKLGFDTSMPPFSGGDRELIVLLYFFWMGYNLLFVAINSIRAAKGKDAKYFPKIRFIPN